jgi:beta-lactam-binding protein with PASTA domain
VADRDHLHARFQTRYAANAPRGTAFSQDPPSGAQVPSGTPITVLISNGPRPVAIPNVVGKSSGDAKAAMQSVGLLVNVTTVPAPGQAPGTVVSQQPDAPATAVPGATVALQEAEVPSWHTVTSFSGSQDGQQSVPFRIRGDRWQVKYAMNYQGTCTFFVVCFGPHLDLQSITTGETVKTISMGTGDNTQGYSTGPGTYQLQVNAGQDSADWTVTVQDLY